MSGLANMYDLKDEEQAKEYLKTLGIEYRFQCYQENRPDGCHRLADFLEAFKKDYERAHTVYMKNCEENKYGHSCFKLGNYKLLGRGCMKDVSKALEFYEEGCNNGYGASCHNVGLVLQSGRANPEGKRDFLKAARFQEKGCDLGNIPSCQLLSTFYIAGKPGLEKDMSKAFQFAEKACEGGHMYACVNLSQMYKRGEGVQQNDELAEKFKEKATAIHKGVTEVEETLTFGK